MNTDESITCHVLTTAPRGAEPTEPTESGSDLPFRVWAMMPNCDEDPLPWKCVSLFRYLPEAVDYLGYCTGRGVGVVFQSPNGVRRV